MMIAAHHIALLLLSTVEQGSPGHREIIQLNGPGVWLALSELTLVERESEQALWCLTERGQVFVDHILALPLPEQSWRMPGADTAVKVPTPMLPAGVRFVPTEDEGQAPPPPPPASMLPKIADIPTDPVARKVRALQLADSGFGLGEVSRMLNLTPEQSQAIFYGG